MKNFSILVAISSALLLSPAIVNTANADSSSKNASSAKVVAKDSYLTSKVKAQLAADKDTSAMNIKVVTTGGVVTLTGVAASEAEKTRAEQIAAATDGVRSVDNQLVVASR